MADSWLELSHKTPEPLSAQLENRVTTRSMKDFAWEGAEFGQTLHLFRIGKEPRAVPVAGVLFLLCSRIPECHTCAVRSGLEESKDLLIPDG